MCALQDMGQMLWSVWNTIIELDIYGASVTGLIANGMSAIQPDKFDLTGYPNPFNPVAVLRYGLPEALNVSVSVYDVSGRKIAQLEDRYRLAGIHTLTWDAKDDIGRQVASGMYLLRIQAGRYFKTIKLTYIR
jgi:FlgD Ig-like domain